MNTPGGWGLFAGWLLKSSAQAALLVVLVLAVQWLLRRWLTPRWRYFLWWLVVARLLMPVSLPGPVSIFNWVKWNSPPAPTMAVTPVAPEIALPASPAEIDVTAFEETTPELPPQAPAAITAPAMAAPARPPLDWRLGVMWLWLAGVALLGARLVWSVLRLRRELRTATPVSDPAVLALLEECRAQMQVREWLTLLETALVNSPALCGFWRPRLLLPPGLCGGFSAPQLRFIFLHELAHVRRHDIVVNWLIALLQLLHWFNPLVWLAFARLRADRELACDALALSVAAPGEQHAYGQTIIRLLEGFARPSAMPGLVGILEDKNQMKRRIRMIAQFRRPGRWAWLSGIAAAILGIVCLTDAQTPMAKEETKETTKRSGSAEPTIVVTAAAMTNQVDSSTDDTGRFRAEPDYSAVANDASVQGSNTVSIMAITCDGGVDLNMANGQIEASSNVVIQTDQQTMESSSFSIIRRDGKFLLKSTGGRLKMVKMRSPLTNRVPRLAGHVRERDVRNIEAVSAFSDRSGQPVPKVISGTVFGTEGGKRTLGFAWEGNIDRAVNVSPATVRDFKIRLDGSLIWGDTATLLREGDQLIIRANELFIEEERRVSSEKSATSSEKLDTTEAAAKAERAEVKQVSPVGAKTSTPNLSGNRTNMNAATDRNGPGDSSTKRDLLLKRMDQIRLPQIEFNGVPLPQVIQELARLARQNDPEHRGVNFLLSAPLHTKRTPSVNPQTGLSEEPTNAPPDEVLVSTGELKNVTLGQALDAVAKGASQPIRFLVESYAVVCTTAAEAEQPVLFTRWWKVDQNQFARALAEQDGAQITNRAPAVAGGGIAQPISFLTNAPLLEPERFRRFLKSNGIDLTPPRHAYFKDRLGMLMVRATKDELERIDKAVAPFVASHPEAEPALPDGLDAGQATDPAVRSMTNALIIRWFKIDPNTFARNLDELVVVGATNQSSSDSWLATSRFTNAPSINGERMRLFFASLGVDLSPPKNCYFALGKGMMMVRATRQDLDVIEQAIQVLNAAAPQVSIEIKFAEVSSDDPDGVAFLNLLGFDPAATNGTSPTPAALNPNEVKAMLEREAAVARLGNTNQIGSPKYIAPPLFTSVLKAAQFRAVVQALEKRKGVELLSMPTVTTLSGRQAQSKTVEIKYVVTDIDHSPAPDRKPQPVAEPFELGPILDVIPDVSADGRTIRMTMIPTIKEFLGYDMEAAKQFQKATGNPTPTPLPKFRLRQVIANANVADGQTVVLSPGAVEVEAKSGSRKGKPTRKHLFIFITPTLIDPAGNRIHRE